MTWQLLVGISVILFSFNGLLHRILMKNVNSDPYAQTIAFNGGVGILALIIVFIRGNFQYKISLDQAPYFLIAAIFLAVGTVFSFKSIKLLEASESSIFGATQKLWTVLGAFILLGEAFSQKKILGTVIIIIGIAVAQWRKKKFVVNKGVVYALLTAICYSIAEISAYHVLQNFDTMSFIVYLSLFPTILLFIFKHQAFKKLNFYLQPKIALNISIVCVNDVLATFTLLAAYQLGRNASQIVPLSSLTTILTVLLGITILKEKDNMVNKILGSVIIVLGVILVI